LIETARSQQLWAICTRFNILPNDPKLKELTPFQCVWIIANMNEEAAQHEKLLKGGNSESYKIDASNFDEGSFRALEGLASNGRTS
jgi:hypothetical protein